MLPSVWQAALAALLEPTLALLEQAMNEGVLRRVSLPVLQVDGAGRRHKGDLATSRSRFVVGGPDRETVVTGRRVDHGRRRSPP
mgnify:CR=1 FL=1